MVYYVDPETNIPTNIPYYKFIQFLIEAEDAVHDSGFQKFDGFICKDFALVKLVQIEILELITCSATATGILVKRALTSNETKVYFFWIY